jgi:hypothetical protein
VRKKRIKRKKGPLIIAQGLLSLFSLISQDRNIELKGEMALHSSPTILERALQALQEYERNQAGQVPGPGLPLQSTPRPTVPSEPVLATPLAVEKDSAASQIFRWAEARCARRDGVWGAEQFLWRDYHAWSQQSKQSACPRELFRETLNQCFDREAGGWQGIALAIDVAVSRYVM